LNVKCTSAFDKVIKERLVKHPNTGNPRFRIFPGLINDELFCRIAEELVIRLSDIFPDQDWSPCLTVPGYWPSHRGGIATSTKWDLKPTLRKTLTMMGFLMYKNRESGPTAIKRTSSTSQPLWTSSLTYKKALADFWMNHGYSILFTYDKSGYEGLLQLPLAIVYAGTVKFRNQPDRFRQLTIRNGKIVGFEHKNREVFDYMGIKRISYKRLTDRKFRQFPYFQAPRSRQVVALSQTVNLPNIFFYKAIQRGMFKPEFGGAIWKNHEGSENVAKLQLVTHPYVLKVDVTELDRHLHYDVLNSIRTGYSKAGCSKRWTDHLTRCIHSPILCIQDYAPYTDWAWTYDPRKIKEAHLLHDYGMPSGYAGVSPEDKAAFTAVLFSTLVEIGQIPLDFNEEHLLAFLGNQLPGIKCINCGDDTVLAFSSKDVKDTFLNTLMKVGLKVEEEEIVTFLGQEFVRVGDSITAIPQIVNSLKNILVPEHEWGGIRRQTPGFGIIERNKYYSSNPAWPIVWNELNAALRRNGLVGLDDYIRDGSNPENRPPVSRDMQNLNDVTFLMNPDSINYKLNEEEVSRDLLDLYYLTYDEEDSTKLNYLWEQG